MTLIKIRVVGPARRVVSSHFAPNIIVGTAANMLAKSVSLRLVPTLVADTTIHKNELELSFGKFVKIAAPFALLHLALVASYVLLNLREYMVGAKKSIVANATVGSVQPTSSSGFDPRIFATYFLADPRNATEISARPKT